MIMETMHIYKRGISSNQMFNTSELDDDEFDAMSKKEVIVTIIPIF